VALRVRARWRSAARVDRNTAALELFGPVVAFELDVA
jgi:hypothetical protein